MYASKTYWDYDEGKYVVRVHSKIRTKVHHFIDRDAAEEFRRTIPHRLETLNKETETA